MKSEENKIAKGAGFGVVFGIILGSVIDNVGLGIALGISPGAGLGSIVHKKDSTENKKKLVKSLLSFEIKY